MRVDRETKTIITAALRAAGAEQQIILAVIELLEGKGRKGDKAPPVLVSQAEAARLASVSRHTIRKMCAAGKLHPVEVLPGLLRYRIEELL